MKNMEAKNERLEATAYCHNGVLYHRHEASELHKTEGAKLYTRSNQAEIDALKAEVNEAKAAWLKKKRENATLKAENERLRNALKPFAAYAPHYPKQRTYGNRPATGEWHNVETGGLGRAEITVEDFHNAAELINK